MINLAKITADVLTKNFSNYSYTLNENRIVLKDNTQKDTIEKESFFDLGLF